MLALRDPCLFWLWDSAHSPSPETFGRGREAEDREISQTVMEGWVGVQWDLALPMEMPASWFVYVVGVRILFW